MSKFVKATVSFKPVGAQAFPPTTGFIPTDSILFIKEVTGTNAPITVKVKPEYLPMISAAIYGDARVEISSISISAKDYKVLTE